MHYRMFINNKQNILVFKKTEKNNFLCSSDFNEDMHKL